MRGIMGDKLIQRRNLMLTEEIQKMMQIACNDKEAIAALSVIVAMLNNNQKEMYEKLTNMSGIIDGFQARFSALEKAIKQ